MVVSSTKCLHDVVVDWTPSQVLYDHQQQQAPARLDPPIPRSGHG